MKPMPVLLVLAAVGAGWWFMTTQTGPSQQDAPPPPVVVVSTPVAKAVTEWDEYAGRFQATERVEIRARVSGYLDEVRFTDGQKVTKGQTLFLIDPRPFSIALERAEARLNLAQKEYERARSLRKSNTIAQRELDRRTQEYQDARAAVEEAKLDLEFTRVTSPMDGRVGRRLVDRGNLVNGSDMNATLLTVIVADRPIYFYFEASEQDMLRIMRRTATEQKREKVTVYAKLQDEQAFTHEGHLDFIDTEIDSKTGSIQGRALFPNAEGMLISGLFGRLRIPSGAPHEVLLIPNEAVGSNQAQKVVFTVNKEGMVEPRPVVLGPVHEGSWRIVRSGITAGDPIIWSGLAKVRPGLKVSTKPLVASDAAENEAGK
jgi:RND family efflux transporter MFP subunit